MIRNWMWNNMNSRRYGIYWNGERVNSFDTREQADNFVKNKSNYEIVLESDNGKFIRSLKMVVK